MDTILPSKPSRYTRLLRDSLYLYTRSFSKVMPLAILLSIFVFIPNLILYLINMDNIRNLSYWGLHQLWLFLFNLAGLTCFIGIIWAMHCLIRHISEPLVKDLKIGTQKVLAVIIVTVLQMAILFILGLIIIGIQMLLFKNNLWIRPGNGLLLNIFILILFAAQFFLIVYVSTLLVFLIPIITTEKKDILAAVEHSISLVWNHWWRTFSLQITPWIIFVIILFILRIGANIPLNIYLLEEAPFSFYGFFFHIFIFSLFIPWVAALLILQMHDLELRKKLAHKNV